MKKQTKYSEAKAIAKKLRNESLMTDYIKLVDKVSASIVKNMKAFGHDILDDSGTGSAGELEFLAFKDVIEKNIIGITKAGEIMFSNETPADLRRCIIDGDMGIENAIALDDELRGMLVINKNRTV